MSTYSKIEDIEAMSAERFSRIFEKVTGRAFVDGGDNKCEVLWLSCNLEDLQYWKFVMSNPALARTVILVVVDDGTVSGSLLDAGVFRQLAGPHEDQDRQCILKTTVDNPSFQRDWRRQLKLQSRNGPQEREQMIDRQYEWVRHQVEAHLDIREKMLDKQLFLDTLKRNLLPNLTKVVLTNLPTDRFAYPRPEEPYTPPSRSPSVLKWEDEYPEGPVPLSGVHPRNCWSWSSGDATDRLEDMEQGVSPATNRCLHLPPRCAPFRGLSIILEVLQKSSTRLTEFSIIPGSDYPEQLLRGIDLKYLTGFPLAFFLPPFIEKYEEQVSALERVVENLTTFRFSIGCSGLGPGESFSRFFQLLSKAKKLKSLHLHIEDWRGNDSRDLLNFISAPSLEELDLDGVEFTEDAFLRFLGRHPNLKRLSLYGCMYRGRSWWDLLTKARVTLSLLRTKELYINEANWQYEDGEYAEDNRLKLPEVSRQYGIERWRRWMTNPTKETFPFPGGAF